MFGSQPARLLLPLTLMEKSNCLLQPFQLSQLLVQASHLYGQLLVFSLKIIYKGYNRQM